MLYESKEYNLYTNFHAPGEFCEKKRLEQETDGDASRYFPWHITAILQECDKIPRCVRAAVSR